MAKDEEIKNSSEIETLTESELDECLGGALILPGDQFSKVYAKLTPKMFGSVLKPISAADFGSIRAALCLNDPTR
jgi:hypothetical protein